MINNLLKNWLISFIYMYLLMLLGHFEMPISDTNIISVMSRFHISLFIFTFFVALLLQLWRSLLPNLHKNYGLWLGMLLSIAIISYAFFMPHFEIYLNFLLLDFILIIQLVLYHSYNKNLTTINTKTNKLMWLIPLIILLFMLIFGRTNRLQTSKKETYLQFYPTQEEIEELYQQKANEARIYSGNRRSDVNTAYYTFADFYIREISCAMSIKNETQSFNDYYSYYVGKETSLKGRAPKLSTNIDGLDIYIDQIEIIEGTEAINIEKDIFAVYNGDDYKIYLSASLEENTPVTNEMIIKDIESFFKKAYNN